MREENKSGTEKLKIQLHNNVAILWHIQRFLKYIINVIGGRIATYNCTTKGCYIWFNRGLCEGLLYIFILLYYIYKRCILVISYIL